jgi:type VI secretion system protein ImpJ
VRESYIPPALAIGASAELMRVLEALHGQVLSKSSELANRRREQGGLADFGTGDFRSYLQFHTVNAAIPLMQHAIGQRGMHPEALYLMLARLAGELSAFSLKVRPGDVPAYEHGGLRETFARLRAILTELLESKEIVSTLQIPLEKDGFTHVARLEDARLLEPSTRMFLGVASDLDEARLIGDLPNIIKIASRDRIDAIIAGGLRGLPIHFEHNPPGTLQTRSMFRYFQIEPRGDEWDAIKGARNLAIFVPAHIPNVTLQLLGHLG